MLVSHFMVYCSTFTRCMFTIDPTFKACRVIFTRIFPHEVCDLYLTYYGTKIGSPQGWYRLLMRFAVRINVLVVQINHILRV